MDDVLVQHADRVQRSNADFLARAQAARSEADAAAREAIAVFGRRLAELSGEVEAARADLAAALDAIVATAATQLDDAFGDNVAAISLSTTAAQDEFAARRAFLTTGRLPAADPLPRATELTFRDANGPTAEIGLFPGLVEADAGEQKPTQQLPESEHV